MSWQNEGPPETHATKEDIAYWEGRAEGAGDFVVIKEKLKALRDDVNAWAKRDSFSASSALEKLIVVLRKHEVLTT